MVAPSTTRRLLDHFAALPDPSTATAATDDRLGLLTERERRGADAHRARALQHRDRADLVVAETTVKTHVGRILAKTGSRDRVQLVVLGYESGLVTP